MGDCFIRIFRTVFIVFLEIFICFNSFAQFKNSIWCFGDSTGINFSYPNNPFAIETGMRSRGSAVSIANKNDSLLFYANTRTTMPGSHTGIIYNHEHNIMQNGTNIVGVGWYFEMVILPMPLDSNQFYLFSIGVTSAYGLYYSVIDMTLDSGRGAVTLKNVQLQNSPMNDGLTAIKHGNGRDWWLFFRDYDPNLINHNNNFYSYLISPLGISNFNTQSIGTVNLANSCALKFNKDGSKLASIDLDGLIELYDFNRCNGMLSNPLNIQTQSSPAQFLWSSEFSSNGNILYISANPNSSYLFQYDLTAPSIAATKDTLWSTAFPQYCGGQLELAPDNKIYYSSIYYNNIMFPYPYPDSVYNIYNMYLGVINSPDSLGSACNFQPYSFYLGGKRTYLGLPNNPDYEMMPLYGSVCDSLSTGIENISFPKGELFVTYVSGWEKLFVNAQRLNGKRCTLEIFDINGRVIFKSTKNTSPPYYTQDVSLTGISNGMYFISLQTEKDKLVKKFVKY